MSVTPKPAALRDAIAWSISASLKAYDVAAMCTRLGLAPQGEGEDPFRSKRIYVLSRLHDLDTPALVDLARTLLDEWDDDDLAALVASFGARGVDGEMSNLIFAANGPKPHIVLRDAINNVIEIVRNAEHCLVYDRPLDAHGLTWSELVAWWGQRQRESSGPTSAARALWKRLSASLASPAESTMFRGYTARYRSHPDAPALIPQVYLHYDPYVRGWTDLEPGAVVRQRMDFLLLLPHRARVVIEVDGRQHYATAAGKADTEQYAAMMREDRRLRLAGYEVYRFGASELSAGHESEAMVQTFFDDLLRRHEVDLRSAARRLADD